MQIDRNTLRSLIMVSRIVFFPDVTLLVQCIMTSVVHQNHQHCHVGLL